MVGELDHLLDVIAMTNHTHHHVLLVFLSLALAMTTVDARPLLQTTAGTTIQDLRGVDELKTMFNRDAGKVRLVLLLSPT
jgi:hypothetical protein